MHCPSCGTGMKALFTGLFCPNDCDRPKPEKAPPTGLKYYTRFDGARVVMVSRFDDIPLNAKEGLWVDAARRDPRYLVSPHTVEEVLQWKYKSPDKFGTVIIGNVSYRAWVDVPATWAQDLAKGKASYEQSLAKGYVVAYVIPPA